MFTSDGGQTWKSQNTGVRVDLSAIRFANHRTGYAVGADGIVLSTTDGGETWKTRRLGPNNFSDVALVDATSAYVVGGSGIVFATTNGGTTWTSTHTIDTYIRDVQFVGSMSGWAATHTGILRTSDGGQSWSSIPLGDSVDALTFVDDQYGWVLQNKWSTSGGDSSSVVRSTTDGGLTWTPIWTVAEPVSDLQFIDRTHGWLVGAGKIWATGDGGKTWGEQKGGPSFGFLRGVHFLDALHGTVVGDFGFIATTSDGGGNWHKVRGRELDETACMANSAVGWSAGRQGTVAQTRDGGKTWNERSSPVKQDLAAAFCLDPQTGWIAGKQGTILATHDGGDTWVLQDSRVSADLFSVYFVDRRRGWAAGDNGTIVATTDGGDTWRVQREGDRIRLVATRFVNPLVGWAAGGTNVLVRFQSANLVSQSDKSTLLRTIDGGRTWQPHDAGTDSMIQGLYFEDEQHGWAVGDDGAVITTSDGGVTWRPRPVPTNNDLKVVFFVNPTTGWIAGKSVLLATRDGGESWQQEIGLPVWKVFPPDFTAGGALKDGAYVAGKPESLLLATLSRAAPYVEELSQEDTATGVALRVRIAGWTDRSKVSCPMIEFKREAGAWERISLNRPLVPDERGEFVMNWTPGAPPHVVREGSTVRYRFTIVENGLTFPHEFPASFPYRPWWDRQHAVVQAGVAGLGGLAAYWLFCFALLWIAPIALVRMHAWLPIQKLIDGISSRGVASEGLKAALALVLPYFVQRPRTRRAWLDSYRRGTSSFDDLDIATRQRFAADRDVMRAWIERYAAGRVRFDDLDAETRVRYLGEPFCLDAWVARRAQALRAAIERTPLFTQRPMYIPTSVSVSSRGGNTILTEPAADELIALWSASVRALVILGLGGSGKSTLACELARRWIEPGEGAGAGRPARIPLLIEGEVEDVSRSATQTLTRMIGDDETDQDIVDSLLLHGRAILILDGLSERSPRTQEYIASVHGHMPGASVLITARNPIDMGPVPVITVTCEPLTTHTLVYFVNEYIRRTEAHRVFPARQQVLVSSRIVELVEGSPSVRVTPLLLKAFIDNAVSAFQRGMGIEVLPVSVPEVFLEYLRRLNPQGPSTPDHVPDAQMLAAARTVAAVELDEAFVPRVVRRTRVEQALRRTAVAGEIVRSLGRLIANGVLEESAPGGIPMLRFALDPVAEYLAALHWLELLSDDRKEWDSFLMRLAELPGYPQTMSGFLRALADCAETYGTQFGVRPIDLGTFGLQATSDNDPVP
jgi:photosystem II stability/assembly factor-like uncharacterized protein